MQKHIIDQEAHDLNEVKRLNSVLSETQLYLVEHHHDLNHSEYRRLYNKIQNLKKEIHSIEHKAGY
jgi:hypothetical protein